MNRRGDRLVAPTKYAFKEVGVAYSNMNVLAYGFAREKEEENMPEESIYFVNEGMKLYGMLHRPAEVGLHPAVVFLHGFFDVRLGPNWLFVKLARRLMAEGITSLRFDFRGSGESEGEFSDVTVLGEVSDALVALDWLAAQPEIDADRMGLVGYSLGGCIAAIVAGRRPDLVKSLVLLSAVAHPVEAFQLMYNPPGGAPPAVRVDNGYEIVGHIVGDALLEELPRVQPLQELAHYHGPALIVHGTQDEMLPLSGVEAYKAVLGERAREHLVEGADHAYRGVGWRQEVIDVISSFLRETLV